MFRRRYCPFVTADNCMNLVTVKIRLIHSDNFINLAKRSYKLLNHFLFIFKALAVFLPIWTQPPHLAEYLHLFISNSFLREFRYKTFLCCPALLDKSVGNTDVYGIIHQTVILFFRTLRLSSGYLSPIPSIGVYWFIILIKISSR